MLIPEKETFFLFGDGTDGGLKILGRRQLVQNLTEVSCFDCFTGVHLSSQSEDGEQHIPFLTDPKTNVSLGYELPQVILGAGATDFLTAQQIEGFCQRQLALAYSTK